MFDSSCSLNALQTKARVKVKTSRRSKAGEYSTQGLRGCLQCCEVSLQQPLRYRWNHGGATGVIHCHCRCSNSQSASILPAFLKTPASQGRARRRSLSRPFTIKQSFLRVFKCWSFAWRFKIASISEKEQITSL